MPATKTKNNHNCEKKIGKIECKIWKFITASEYKSFTAWANSQNNNERK